MTTTKKGLWRGGFDRARTALENNIEKATEREEELTSDKDACSDVNSIPSKEIDWEERHFQICLALISRADLHSYHSGYVNSVEISPTKILAWADKMTEALKEHHAKSQN